MIKRRKLYGFRDKNNKRVIEALREAAMPKDILNCHNYILPNNSPVMLEKYTRHPIRYRGFRWLYTINGIEDIFFIKDIL